MRARTKRIFSWKKVILLNESYSIRQTKKTLAKRNPVITVVILFLAMEIPGFFLAMIFRSFFANEENFDLLEILNNPDDKILLFLLFMTLFVVILGFIFGKFFQKRNLESFGLKNPNRKINYLKGLGLGFAALAIAVLLLKIIGAIDLTNNLANVSPFIFILFIIGWMIQGFEEEFLIRSILMNYFASLNTVILGIIANSLIFAILHLGNDGFSFLPFINIFFMGLIFSFLFYISDDIMLSAAAHSMWNFAQGNIFGISVSGNFPIKNSIFKASFIGNDMLTGGDFGIEGGLAVTFVEIIAIIILYRLAKEKSKEYEKYKRLEDL